MGKGPDGADHDDDMKQHADDQLRDGQFPRLRNRAGWDSSICRVMSRARLVALLAD